MKSTTGRRVRHSRRALVLLLVCAWGGMAQADTVYLKSGAVIAGQVLSENEFEIRIAVSQTVSGSIRTFKLIDRSIVDRWERDDAALAVEMDPGGATARAQELARTFDDAMGEFSVTLRRAATLAHDAETGREDVAALYLELIEDMDSEWRKLQSSALAPDDAGPRLLALRDKAYELLLIALRANLGAQQDELARAKERVAELDRTIADMEEEISRLESTDDDAAAGRDSAGVRRMGRRGLSPAERTRLRDLRKMLVPARSRLRKRTLAIAQIETTIRQVEDELKLAGEHAQQAATEAAALR